MAGSLGMGALRALTMHDLPAMLCSSTELATLGQMKQPTDACRLHNLSCHFAASFRSVPLGAMGGLGQLCLTMLATRNVHYIGYK